MYAGLDVTWAGANGTDEDPTADLVLAEIDAYHPTAVETTPQGLRAFFVSTQERDAAASHVHDVLPHCGTQAVDVPDERWAERSQAALTAVEVGRLIIAPPWDVPADHAGVIIIQPSMGFGTGHHPSTRLCLRLIQAAPVAGATVLDAGTGSGVLAIAAWKLGARSVVALDFDPDSVASARECAALNGALDALDIRQTDLEREPAVPGEPFSLILANLTGGMLVRMAERLVRLAARGGTLIVSGVTLEEENAVTRTFLAHGLHVAGRLAEDEWVGLQFACPS